MFEGRWAGLWRETVEVASERLCGIGSSDNQSRPATTEANALSSHEGGVVKVRFWARDRIDCGLRDISCDVSSSRVVSIGTCEGPWSRLLSLMRLVDSWHVRSLSGLEYRRQY